MATKKKSWGDKLAADKDLPKVVTIDATKRSTWGSGTCAIPRPRDVDALMKQVPKGKVTTINELRALVAAQHQATMGCPLTTGIFSWIAAHAAEEAAAAGAKRVTPWWRTLKSGGKLNPKFPGGIEVQKARLEAEGHKVIAKGKHWLVADLTKKLWTG